MTFATHYSGAGGRPDAASGLASVVRVLSVLVLLASSGPAWCESATNLVARAENEFQLRRSAHTSSPTNTEAAWRFAHACFDRAEFATNTSQRAALAKQGVKACREVLARETNSAPAHYYLGMNLGQLARTKLLGAFPIVDEMEREFKAARAADELLDFAGPDRLLGRLYLEAPSFGSIGDRKKAGLHLKRALKLAPDYPENRLNLVEASVRWGELKNARQELATLEAALDPARKKFSGELWLAAWTDWERRLQLVREKLSPAAKPVAPLKNSQQ